MRSLLWHLSLMILYHCSLIGQLDSYYCVGYAVILSVSITVGMLEMDRSGLLLNINYM